jgi:hypothetical protein
MKQWISEEGLNHSNESILWLFAVLPYRRIVWRVPNCVACLATLITPKVDSLITCLVISELPAHALQVTHDPRLHFICRHVNYRDYLFTSFLSAVYYVACLSGLSHISFLMFVQSIHPFVNTV